MSINLTTSSSASLNFISLVIQSMIQCPNSSDRVWLRMPTATSGASIYSCRTKKPNKYCLACFSLLTTLLAAFLSFFHKSFTLARLTVRIGLSWKRFKHGYSQKRAKNFHHAFAKASHTVQRPQTASCWRNATGTPKKLALLFCLA